MLHREAVLPGTLDLLIRLMRTPACANFRLAGGTALALQIGHRLSDDLDLFCPDSFDPHELFRELGLHDATVTGTARDTLRMQVGDIKVEMFRYAYALVSGPLEVDGVRMFAIPDLAAMKLSAIANRGARKDFIDVAFILREHDLDELLAWYRVKFVGYDVFPVLRSLVYFADAEDEPEPQMLRETSWAAIKRSIREALAQLERA